MFFKRKVLVNPLIHFLVILMKFQKYTPPMFIMLLSQMIQEDCAILCQLPASMLVLPHKFPQNFVKSE